MDTISRHCICSVEQKTTSIRDHFFAKITIWSYQRLRDKNLANNEKQKKDSSDDSSGK